MTSSKPSPIKTKFSVKKKPIYYNRGSSKSSNVYTGRSLYQSSSKFPFDDLVYRRRIVDHFLRFLERAQHHDYGSYMSICRSFIKKLLVSRNTKIEIVINYFELIRKNLKHELRLFLFKRYFLSFTLKKKFFLNLRLKLGLFFLHTNSLRDSVPFFAFTTFNALIIFEVFQYLYIVFKLFKIIGSIGIQTISPYGLLFCRDFFKEYISRNPVSHPLDHLIVSGTIRYTNSSTLTFNKQQDWLNEIESHRVYYLECIERVKANMVLAPSTFFFSTPRVLQPITLRTPKRQKYSFPFVNHYINIIQSQYRTLITKESFPQLMVVYYFFSVIKELFSRSVFYLYKGFNVLRKCIEIDFQFIQPLTRRVPYTRPTTQIPNYLVLRSFFALWGTQEPILVHIREYLLSLFDNYKNTSRILRKGFSLGPVLPVLSAWYGGHAFWFNKKYYSLFTNLYMKTDLYLRLSFPILKQFGGVVPMRSVQGFHLNNRVLNYNKPSLNFRPISKSIAILIKTGGKKRANRVFRLALALIKGFKKTVSSRRLYLGSVMRCTPYLGVVPYRRSGKWEQRYRPLSMRRRLSEGIKVLYKGTRARQVTEYGSTFPEMLAAEARDVGAHKFDSHTENLLRARDLQKVKTGPIYKRRRSKNKRPKQLFRGSTYLHQPRKSKYKPRLPGTKKPQQHNKNTKKFTKKKNTKKNRKWSHNLR